MECPRCKAIARTGAKFCVECGSALPRACPACGQIIPPQAKFCPECGAIIAPGSKAAEPAQNTLARASTPAERRQLAVMFCDMMGSSALSNRLDPEEQREVVSAFQSCCADQVRHLGGMVAQYLGDGVLAYFGYPAAHEDDAERAIRAGLSIVDAVGQLQPAADVSLRVRIGIASGVVVVGDLVRDGVTQENAAIGETTNLAARLQALAEPDTLLICPETHRLVGALFEYVDLGPQEIKGFQKPIHVRRVTGASAVESRFEARAAATSPLLGRGEELDLLIRRWEQVKGGSGRVVMVAGEAGIGKSRLTRALQERLTAEPHIELFYHCSPYHQDSSLYPIVAQLNRAAAIDRGDTPEAKLEKLQAMLSRTIDSMPDDLPAIAALLSIPGGDRFPAPKVSPQRLKELTQRVLLERLRRLAESRPVLMLFEDLHWADPTTLELLSVAVENASSMRLLLVGAARPDFAPRWPSHAHVSTILLNRLERASGIALVEDVTKGKPLPAEVLEQILLRTDGVPLFIEELTKFILEGGLLRDVGDRYVLTGPLPPLAIPSTLRASLIARLDRLSSIKDIAQIGATIGREFSYKLLAAVSGLTDERLQTGLGQLVTAELIYQRGAAPDSTYIFKHGLVQDASYASLVRSRRQQLHGLVARALEEQFPETADVEPEIVAHHYAEAGMAAPAIRYWKQAGDKALERSANPEAIDHFKRVLGLAKDLTDEERRMEAEFEGLYGLGKGTFAAGHLREAMTILKDASVLARKMNDPKRSALSALSFDQAYFLAGKVPHDAMQLLREAMARLPAEERNLRCQILGRLGRVHRMNGEPELAAALDREAIDLARDLNDVRALFDVLSGKFVRPDILKQSQFAARGEELDELIATSRKIDDVDYLGRALSFDIFFAAEIGDYTRLENALETYHVLSEKHHALAHQWVARNGEAMRAILDGDFAEAERLSEGARAIGADTQSESVDGVYGMQMFTIRREQDRLAEVAPVIKRFVDEESQNPAWRPGFALIASDLGFMDAARRMLAEHAEAEFQIASDAIRSTALSYLAEVAVACKELSSANRLYELILDYQHMTITAGLVTVCYGSAGRYLGMLAAALGDHERAADHFEQALVMNAALRARPWLAHTQAEYAILLRACGDSAAIRRADTMAAEALQTATDLGMTRLTKRLTNAASNALNEH